MNLRVLKIIVVVMGVMLVAGFVALVVVIAGRVSQRGPVTQVGHPFTSAPVELPAGARIESMTATGDRLVLAILAPAGNRQLVIIDLASGRQLGTISLRTAP